VSTRRIQFPLLFLAIIGVFTTSVAENIRGPVYPQMLKSFGVYSETLGGVLLMTSYIFGLLSAWIAFKKMGAASPLVTAKWGASLFALGMFGFAMAPSYWWAVAASCVFGFGSTWMNYSGNLLTLSATPENLRARTMSLFTMCYGIASIACPVFVSATTDFLTWREVVLSSLILFIIYLACVFWVSRLTLEDYTPPSQPTPPRPSLKLWAHVFMICIYVSSEIIISTWFVRFMEKTHQDLSSGYIYLTGFFIALSLGRLVSAVFVRGSATTLILTGSGVCTLVLLVLGIWWEPMFLIGSAFTMAPFYPVAISQMSRTFGNSYGGAVSLVMGGICAGVAVSHFLVGVITDLFSDLRMGLSVAIVEMCIVLVLVAINHKHNVPDTDNLLE
jgi:FHS family glucose/mannose:H+ symporter-like MFS transporter